MQRNLAIIAGIIIALAVGAAIYFTVGQNVAPNNSGSASGVEYRNDTYGFSIALPETWRGYTVSIDTWSGYAVGDQLGETPAAQGPVVSIHNPKWTAAHPHQDIPIMVFTPDQWNQILQEKLSVGAAPIPPSELGRNAKYVFALPARYNYAFPPGWEEVEQILQGKPFKAF